MPRAAARSTPATRRRRQPLTRARIVDAAIALADESGIENVGMRSVARRLGVDPMSLYNHVDGRAALFDGVVERLLELADLPGPERWDRWARTAAERIKQLALAHPGAFLVFAGHSVTTADAAAHIEPFVVALVRGGFPIESCALIVNTFLGFVASCASLRTMPPLTDRPALAEVPAEMRARLPAAAAAAEAALTTDPDAQFDIGVELLIDGLRARLRRERRARR